MEAPDDLLGTVRAGQGVLAIRAHSMNPEWDDELSWFIIDIGIGAQGEMNPDQIEAMIGTWPIVYQPDNEVLCVHQMGEDRPVACFPRR